MTDKLNTSRSTSNIPSTQNTLMAIAAVAPTLKITDVNSGEIIGNGDTVASVPNFSGKAEPFGVISISFKLPNGGVFSARTTANAEGEWFVGAPAHLMGYTLNVTVRSGVLFSETIQITTDPNFVKPEPAQPEVPEEPVLPVVPSEPELPESPEEPITPVVINLAIDKVGEKQVLRNESSEKSDDIRPTFHGTAGALQIVTLYAGHTVLGSARAVVAY
ncbi:hypothetical protein HX773_13545 [Pantoea sp. B9002]|uniref:hypothetical protein n=1 Tax=Pantoea sp. B9002 TaxID=2726979 RepID=UPI0015A14C56|nr:hypothetical protein [Pantoea sp. B9002]NWA61913.1 hypothetical protein [Pantoea sp. B9002]